MWANRVSAQHKNVSFDRGSERRAYGRRGSADERIGVFDDFHIHLAAQGLLPTPWLSMPTLCSTRKGIIESWKGASPPRIRDPGGLCFLWEVLDFARGFPISGPIPEYPP